MTLVGTAFTGNKVSIFEYDRTFCISSNSIPDHEIGKFPNRGNPNSIRERHIKMCIPNIPAKSEEAKYVKGTISLALNGIQFQPIRQVHMTLYQKVVTAGPEIRDRHWIFLARKIN